ncbi:MAG: hypothetical protein IJW70_09850 [Clostridia bacterium]|nr:hypothetical protein [Clostridia bacterium]
MKRAFIRIYIVAITSVLLALTLCMGTYAAESEQFCEHTFGEWELTIVPDCTQKGEAVRTCAKCGYSESLVVTRPGHVPGDFIMDAAPQIGVAGSMSRSCTVCGEILQTEVIAPLPEPESEPEPETEAPTLPEENWIDVPLPLALLAFILPNLILVAVLVIRAIRKRIEKLKL